MTAGSTPETNGRPHPDASTSAEDNPLEPRIWSALTHIQDPELPVGIVDLGLVYAIRLDAGRVEVDLTHTAIGCPAIEMMQEDVQAALRRIPEVREVYVRTVWDPPWTKGRITPRGRVLLTAFGVSL